MFGGNFAPAGWQFCDGTLLPIAEYDTLFNLIGTTYGGDGQTTFAVPDLRGRFPMHQGTQAGLTLTLGQAGGEEEVTLTQNQIPAHTHPMTGSSVASAQSPSGTVPAAWSDQQYSTTTPSGGVTFAASVVGSVGGSQPHDNRAPFLALNFIISLFGVYPTQN